MIKFNIFNQEYIIDNTSIETVCLFGSSARGDYDLTSDIDLFIIIGDCDEDSYVNTKKQLALILKMPIDWISLYRKSTVLQMHDLGSYFLWHLKKEGTILFSRTNFIDELLSVLPPYTRIKGDLLEYLEICKDIRHSISVDTTTIDYELAVLASLMRNTCITLCYIYGKFLFGRVSPVQATQEIIGMSFITFTIEEYEVLYSYRLARVRKQIKPRIKSTVEMVKFWLDQVEYLIDYCLKKEKRL